jgi:hypothetical protein
MLNRHFLRKYYMHDKVLLPIKIKLCPSRGWRSGSMHLTTSQISEGSITSLGTVLALVCS